jgi:acyltransferase
MDNSLNKKRIGWVDRAKAYGILLVFWGHFVERVCFSGNQAAFFQWKAIYSFHVPLFFILAGFFAKEKRAGWWRFLKKESLTRLVPVLFFGLLAVPFFMLNNFQRLGRIGRKDLIARALSYLLGQPYFNWVTWFLVCLFMVELVHYFLGDYIGKGKRLFAAIPAFYLIGWIVIRKIDFVVGLTGIGENFWFIHEALTAYSFYLFGFLLHNLNYLRLEIKNFYRLSLLLLFLCILLFTFNLNQGPFDPYYPVVMMAQSWHGDILYFPLAALAGSFFIFYLSQLTPDCRLISFLGENTLILLGLNGLFLHFFNDRILNFWTLHFFPIPDNIPSVLIFCFLVSFISLLLCLPLIWIFNKYIPQLVGKPAGSTIAVLT